MELNITELRRQKRPLWMTKFDEECSSALLGGGGDIHTDRLAIDSTVFKGQELPDDDLVALLEGRYVREDYES